MHGGGGGINCRGLSPGNSLTGRLQPVEQIARASLHQHTWRSHVTALEPVDCLSANKRTQLTALRFRARHDAGEATVVLWAGGGFVSRGTPAQAPEPCALHWICFHGGARPKGKDM